MIRASRFVAHFLRPRAHALRVEEVTIHVGSAPVEATLYLPSRQGPVPGWTVLHGMTVPGRNHQSLTRFASALAVSGAAVLVPDIPLWRALRISVQAAADTLAGAVGYLESRREVAAGEKTRAIGFSFGATQALIAAGTTLHGRLGGVVGFGGYCDLHRVAHCMFTGEHEWDGERYRLTPDPYGRWIMAANYLTRVPEYHGMERVAAASFALATESGVRGLPAASPEYDPLKAEIRAKLPAEEREVWDLLAPPAAGPAPNRDARARLAAGLANAALEAEPQLDPRPYLEGLSGRIVLAHGRDDQLIPFTETLRLRTHLSPAADVHTTITGLFAHSVGSARVRPLAYAREALRFFGLMRAALDG